MPKGMPKRGDDQLLEGGGAGGGGGKFTFDRVTGSKGAKDHKEKASDANTREMSGNLRFDSPGRRDMDSGDRTPRMSDDYAKGGMTASKRADGIAQRGRTRGKMY